MTEQNSKNAGPLRRSWAFVVVLMVTALTASAAPEAAGEEQKLVGLSQPVAAGEAVFLAALASDWSQTVQLRNACDGRVGCSLHETNPLLGRSPSRAKVNSYFVGAVAAQLLVLYSLPSEWRGAFVASGVAVEVLVVGRNKQLGLRVKF